MPKASSRRSPVSTRLAGQRAFWNRRYRGDPELFGAGRSPFARWARDVLRQAGIRRGVCIELGVGYGRDLRYLQRCGFVVRGVDASGVGVALARRRRRPAVLRAPEIVLGDANSFLAQIPGQSVDVVYSNMFYNMDFTEAEHVRLFTEVARVLRPGGFHLYSVRSTSDPWYGRGRRTGPDTFDLRPHGSTMHFFSRAYARRLRRGAFSSFAREDRLEGAQDFPIRLFYAADVRNDHPAWEDRPSFSQASMESGSAGRNLQGYAPSSPSKPPR